MIYEHILPAHEVIYVDYTFPWPSGNYKLGFKICRETTEHHGRFSLTHGDWHSKCYATDSQGPYRLHPGFDVATFYTDMGSLTPPGWYSAQFEGPHRQYPTLDLGLFSTCRQTYDEAKHTLYATNTFAFRWGEILLAFMRKFGKGTAHLSIRNISLFVNVDGRRDEGCWNDAFTLMVQKLPGLKNVCVRVDEGYCQGFEPGFRDPLNAEKIFLNGILKLRKLKLSSLVLDVVEGVDAVEGVDVVEGEDEDDPYEIDYVMPERLSPAQKVDWANYVKAAVMGSETNVVAR